MHIRPSFRLLFAAVAAVASLESPLSATPIAIPEAAPEVAVIKPLEVRMRRLHRVRPDLLQYPIVYEQYC